MHARTLDLRKVLRVQIRTALTVQLLIVLACTFFATAHAADTGPGKSRTKSGFQAKREMRLKLDMAVPSAAAIANAEDCDEGDLMLQSMPASDGKDGTSFAETGPLEKLAMADQLSADNTTTTDTKDTDTKDAPAYSLAQAGETANPDDSASKSALATPPADTPKPKRTWEIVPSDKTLRAALARWSASAGWQLVWELPVDYSVEARTSVPGTFEEAVGLVAKGMDGAEIPMKAIFYAGNKVLRIVTKGAE